MITETVGNFFMGVIAAILSVLPSNPAPGWITGITGSAATVFGYAASMGAWFPVALVSTVVLAVVATYLVSFTIKVIRILASFATMGGGSAG